jgi:hypothetical protein
MFHKCGSFKAGFLTLQIPGGRDCPLENYSMIAMDLYNDPGWPARYFCKKCKNARLRSTPRHRSGHFSSALVCMNPGVTSAKTRLGPTFRE